MNNFLFSRALGSIGHQSLARAENARLLHSLHPARQISFSYLREGEYRSQPADDDDLTVTDVAHPAGVNSITIDKFEGRYLLSGGADASIAIWDLDQAVPAKDGKVTHRPLGYASKDDQAHGAGVTHLSFYPFDSLAFLSSSYDHHLRLYSSETLSCSATFDLASVVYSHALSPVASHLLVACATQHPAVRLVDLKSGASTHSLAGHGGAVMSVAWHPTQPHLLASSASDGSARLWDIRRSASSIGVLDMEDSVGIDPATNASSQNQQRRRNPSAKAHNGPANGILWTDSGSHIITTGHDEAARVWDASTGANTLVNFGPHLKNGHGSTLLPLVTPERLTGPGRELLLFPNPREVLVSELHTGRLVARLRAPSYHGSASGSGSGSHTAVRAGRGTRNVLNRTTALAWRAHRVEVYSAHSDGSVRAWAPRTWEDRVADAEVEEGDGEEEVDDDEEGDGGGAARERKRKRADLDEIVAGLTGKKVSFT